MEKVKKLIEEADYFVRLIDFPVGAGCNGMVMANDDGTYSIYLNARASDEQKKKAYLHETAHILRGDLHGNASITEIEQL